MKQEIERRIKEKSDELDSLRKTYQKSIESMQASLENETRAKGEAIRQKKKLEVDKRHYPYIILYVISNLTGRHERTEYCP